MINSILIANRGEIACRVIRTCKKSGIRSIAVYSDADAGALHVQLADEAVYIGPAAAKESYLNMDALVEAARLTGADAIHPGYGFLSENEHFAERLQQEGLIFIGPNPAAIAAMGSKSRSKQIMRERGVPLVPGYEGSDQSLNRFAEEAGKIGYPVLLKAAAGGGGKGMRIVHEPDLLAAAVEGAKREALNAFGNDELLIEKYFESARHIEFQVFGDRHGNVIHLFERECSIQRRYQKVFEESPSPVLSEETRQAMGKAAVEAAKAIGYDNAGTVEFIYAPDGSYYFLEMNTRLQVEHPVTECITGLDLVDWQIRVAQGEKLPLAQHEVKQNGYALECRLYAEDADNQFLPATGKVALWKAPVLDGLRFDTGIQSGSEIGIHYDPMIAKVIAHGRDRGETIRKMIYALEHLACLGLTTNQLFLLQVLRRNDFKAGDYDTHYIANKLSDSPPAQLSEEALQRALTAAALIGWNARQQKAMPVVAPSGWRNVFFAPQQQTFICNGEEYVLKYRYSGGKFDFVFSETSTEAELISAGSDTLTFRFGNRMLNYLYVVDGQDVYLQTPEGFPLKLSEKERYPEKKKAAVKGGYLTPMPAQVVKVLVKAGDTVTAGQSLLILVSMKMENTIAAHENGTIEEIYVQEGMNIEAGKLLLKINPQNES